MVCVVVLSNELGVESPMILLPLNCASLGHFNVVGKWLEKMVC